MMIETEGDSMGYSNYAMAAHEHIEFQDVQPNKRTTADSTSIRGCAWKQI
jgi:hypothetical protein